MNKAAYEALCQDRMKGLYRIALSILRNPADAQDAVQQAFLNAWVHRETAYPGRETGWITRILINECRNIHRHRMRVFLSGLPEKEEKKNVKKKASLAFVLAAVLVVAMAATAAAGLIDWNAVSSVVGEHDWLSEFAAG